MKKSASSLPALSDKISNKPSNDHENDGKFTN